MDSSHGGAHHHHNDARLWRVDALGGLDLFHASFAEFSFAPHAHEEFFIAITESGQARPHFWRGVQNIGSGDVFVLNPGEVHSGGPAQDSIWCYRSFYVPADLMARAAAEVGGSLGGTPGFVESVLGDASAASMLRGAHVALQGGESKLAGESKLLNALAVMALRYSSGRHAMPSIGREHRAVARARDLLETLPAENVSLETLAREAGLSAFRLAHVFRREMGMSPHAYQVLVRARIAKSLLARGASITQAALDAGFFDQAHLTRHFKRIYGVTPGKYREETRGETVASERPLEAGLVRGVESELGDA